MLVHEPMAKDPAQMTSAERIAWLTRDLHSPAFVSKADKLIELMEHELQFVVGMRNTAADRPGITTPAPTPATDPAVQEKAPQPSPPSHERQTLTVSGLAERYRTDVHSPYQQIRFKSRENYDSLLGRIEHDCGGTLLSDLNARMLIALHESWVGPKNHISMAHSLIGMMRGILSFGAAILEDHECDRLARILSKLRFEMAKPRTERLTADHAIAVRAKAHEMKLASIALGQALQFECIMLRQKDVIGEWVPIAEPGTSDVTHRGSKWLRGLRWSGIDKNMILRHTTSKGNKDVEVDLKLAPMVMEELQRFERLPDSGPVITSEGTGLPYFNTSYRRIWRTVADAAGIPKSVKNMDTGADARRTGQRKFVSPGARPPLDGDDEDEERPADADLQSAGRS